MSDALRGRIESELAYAARARAHGKEGRARVCARRAAGWAVGAYRRGRHGEAVSERAAIHHLRWLSQQRRFPQTLQQAAIRLIERVTPEHQLRHAQDPLADARLIVEAFLGLLDPAAADLELE